MLRVLPIVFLVAATPVAAQLLPVVNPGFEDISGQQVFNEFTFGVPTGWSLHDPNAIVAQPDIYVGTLRPNGTQFFSTPAPEGQRVAILFNSGREGLGEYGFTQTLAATLQPSATYTLSVQVGNIASGTDLAGIFYNLDAFPGYRIDLLAGNQVLTSDLNSLLIPEADFAVSTLSFISSPTDPRIGLPLGIRLVNLNLVPSGFTPATSPDLEVDFDDIRLTTFPVIPEPTALLPVLAFPLALRRPRR